MRMEVPYRIGSRLQVHKYVYNSKTGSEMENDLEGLRGVKKAELRSRLDSIALPLCLSVEV